MNSQVLTVSKYLFWIMMAIACLGALILMSATSYFVPMGIAWFMLLLTKNTGLWMMTLLFFWAAMGFFIGGWYALGIGIYLVIMVASAAISSTQKRR